MTAVFRITNEVCSNQTLPAGVCTQSFFAHDGRAVWSTLKAARARLFSFKRQPDAADHAAPGKKQGARKQLWNAPQLRIVYLRTPFAACKHPILRLRDRAPAV